MMDARNTGRRSGSWRGRRFGGILSGCLLVAVGGCGGGNEAGHASNPPAGRAAAGAEANRTPRGVRIDGAAPGEWTMDLAAARAVGAELKLPLFLNFSGSDWCGYCILTERTVFATEAWRTYAADNLMLVIVDFPRDASRVPEKYRARNDALANEFRVEGYPAFFVFDPVADEVIGRFGAFRDMTPESFIQLVRHAVRLSESVGGAEARDLPPAATVLYSNHVARLRAANASLMAWLKTQPAATRENRQRIDDLLASMRDMHDAVDRLLAATRADPAAAGTVAAGDSPRVDREHP